LSDWETKAYSTGQTHGRYPTLIIDQISGKFSKLAQQFLIIQRGKIVAKIHSHNFGNKDIADESPSI